MLTSLVVLDPETVCGGIHTADVGFKEAEALIVMIASRLGTPIECRGKEGVSIIEVVWQTEGSDHMVLRHSVQASGCTE